MNQSAQPDAQSVTPNAAKQPDGGQRRVGVSGLKVGGDLWTTAVMQSSTLRKNIGLVRLQMLPLVIPGVLCAIAALLVDRLQVDWTLAVFTLLACLFALAGVGALAASGQLSTVHATVASIPQRRFGMTVEAPKRTSADELHTYAFRLGCVLIGVAVLCSAPLIFIGPTPAMLVMGLGVLAIALLAFDFVRFRIAPLDELVGAICLGPGLVALTVVAQGYRMDTLDWLVAIALGCLALTVIEGRRLRAELPNRNDRSLAVESEATIEGRSLAALFGRRAATMVAAVAAALAFILAVALSLPRVGAPGALLAVTALPVTILALTALAVSQYEPVRRDASNQLLGVYSWFGLALAIGMMLTVMGEYITSLIMRAIGA